MLAFSPPLFSTTYGWPMVDDLISDHLHQPENHHASLDIEANSYPSSLLNFPTTYDQTLHLHHDFTPEETSISSGGAVHTGGSGDDKMVAKKLNHNASERDRRKRVNDLYAFLRSLLPMSNDQKVKVSIPETVSRALKYVPQLQKEVELLTRKKEKLRLCSWRISGMNGDHVGVKKSGEDGVVGTSRLSVSVLGEKEVVVQMILTKEIELLSNVLEYLEQEEDGLVLLNATTFKCFAEGMVLNTIHLQVQGDHKIEAENLKEKLCTFHR